MDSKMVPKSRLFVNILGPTAQDPSRDAKRTPRKAKMDRKLIQKDVQRVKNEIKMHAFWKRFDRLFFVDGGLAEKDVGFSLKNRRP